jgi:hypothetical protein
MLQWLHENGCPWDEEVWAYAWGNGHTAIIEWAEAHGCEPIIRARQALLRSKIDRLLSLQM